MFVNKLSHTSHVHISERKRCFNVKPLTYYCHAKTKVLADFQICISIPLELKASFFHIHLQNYLEIEKRELGKQTKQQCNK